MQKKQTSIFNKKFYKMSELTDKIRGNWNIAKGKLKQEFASLTDDDLAYEEGKEEELIGRLEVKLGKTKEEIKNFLNL